jgi:release factor glutamine methyltransferase
MIIRDALAEGSGTLAAAGIETPGLDASLLLATVLNTSRSSLLAAGPQPLSEVSLVAFNDLLKRRLAGECVTYIVGRKEFYGLEFAVTPSVLVPRPETELLVEVAKQLAMSNEKRDARMMHGESRVHDKMHHGKSPRNGYCYEEGKLALASVGAKRKAESREQEVRVLDLCTGSGAVAIALKHEMQEWEVCATDISAEALTVAENNAARLLPPNSITFYQGDLYEALSPLLIAHCSLLTDKPPSSPIPHSSFLISHFSFIVSNPPYVPSAEISNLSPEVRREPTLALDGGGDGLDLIRRIISQAPFYLGSGGVLLLEADPRQMHSICALLDQAGFIDVQIHKDLSGKERVIGGRKR